MTTNMKLRIVTAQDLSLRAFVWRHKKSGITFWWDPDLEAWCWSKKETPDGWAKDIGHMSPCLRKTFFESEILS